MYGLSAIDAHQALIKSTGCPRKERSFRLTVEEDPNSKKGQYEIRQKLSKHLGACSVCKQTELSGKLLEFEIPYMVEPLDKSIDIMED